MKSVPNSAEVYICVDVETSGPIPGFQDYSLLSIGACSLSEPASTFYIELKPLNLNNSPAAAAVHKLSLENLMKEGIEPKEALTRFENWVFEQVPSGQKPILVAFNAPFDWMFISYYFHHFLGHNPFGHAALDIKALYMGWAGVEWKQTSWRMISPEYAEDAHLTHHALQDALDQAQLFKKILAEIHNQNQKTRS